METPEKAFVNFNWIIKNVSRESIGRYTSNHPLKTEIFQTWLGNFQLKWCAKLYCKNNEQSIGIYFTKETGCNVITDIIISIKSHGMQSTKEFNDKSNTWGWPSFIEVNELFDKSKEYIDDDNCLTISFKVIFVKLLRDQETSTESIKDFSTKVVCSQFYNRQEFSDFTITCENDEKMQITFPVHRVILADKSKVFMNMFTTEMMEKNANNVLINDINAEVMEVFLKYLYTDTLHEYDYMKYIDVLYAAEKYQVDQLRVVCADRLIKLVNVKNVIKIYITAELHNIQKLSQMCLSTIACNYAELRNSDSLKDLSLPMIMKVMDELLNLSSFSFTSSI